MEKEFTVTIEETISGSFTIKAESLESAINKAQVAYNNGFIVLEPGNLLSKRLCASDENFCVQTNWIDF